MNPSDPESTASAAEWKGLPESAAPERSRWRLPAIVLGALGLLGLGYLLLRPGTKGSTKGPDGPGGKAITVAVATARKGDLEVTLTGLGTVTAMNTVVVKSRVDGQLLRVDFREGQFVKQGELLAEIDPRPFQVQLMQAEGQLAKDKAAFQNASADLRRVQSLVAQGIVSQQQLDTQVSTAAQFEAAMQADQAQVESARLNLVYARITAPIAGRVGLRMVDPGNMVRASDGTGLAVIAPVQPITVLFTIPADNLPAVMTKYQRKDKLLVEAFDRDLKNRLAVGEVMAIDNQVDPATGTVRVKALFTNADLSLYPNQFVNARLRVDTLQGTTIIPTAAFQRGPEGTYVYVVKADSTVEMRPILTQATDGDSSAVQKGLNPGETVVTEGLEKLKPGAKVTLPRTDGAKKAKP
jgi:multidrug efflux system membrane fusion protein